MSSFRTGGAALCWNVSFGGVDLTVIDDEDPDCNVDESMFGGPSSSNGPLINTPDRKPVLVQALLAFEQSGANRSLDTIGPSSTT